MTVFKTLHRWFISFDLYGNRFDFNFLGVETYRTVCGSFFSLLVTFFVGMFTFNNFTRLIYREEPEIFNYQQNLEQEDYEELGKIDIFENRVNMAVKIYKQGKLLALENFDPEVGSVMAGQFSEDKSFGVEGFLNIELQPCTIDHFINAVEEEFEDFRLK